MDDMIGYTVPISGWYRVSSTMTKCIPTGKYETVKNPDKSWYEFWKPKMVTKEIYKYETVRMGTQIVHLNQDEEVSSTFPPERIKN